MAEKTEIAWCDATFNPWVGCSKVSPACDNCYAEIWAKRSGMVKWGGERRRTSNANWAGPWRWEAEALRTGTRRRVFCASLADVFDNQVPIEWQQDLFDLIRATPHLDWLLLTKRIGNAKVYKWPANVWLGISVVNQEEADRDIPKLLSVPARVRFLSMEPLLGPVDLRLESRNDTARWDSLGRDLPLRRIDWVIVGGESGSKARPMDTEWASDIALQCTKADVHFFMKQLSRADSEDFRDFKTFPKGLQVREWPR